MFNYEILSVKECMDDYNNHGWVYVCDGDQYAAVIRQETAE